ncbi:AAA family ATPase [Bacteroides caecigallinarum]|uniref:AAA family ATPase n=1 Tax=Bacteroides caecigallinarum TaxID=1411144 RepID=UPI00293E52A5|nr:AAA family ATPase [Bacteroides caecigallinarum]
MNKTEYIYTLHEKSVYSLSRPRRFGKSMLVSFQMKRDFSKILISKKTEKLECISNIQYCECKKQ